MILIGSSDFGATSFPQKLLANFRQHNIHLSHHAYLQERPSTLLLAPIHGLALISAIDPARAQESR
jgi:hypothetical protein